MLNVRSTVRTMNYLFDRGRNVLALPALRKKVDISWFLSYGPVVVLMSGGILDRKPVDPPPIIQLKIRDDSDPTQYVIINLLSDASADRGDTGIISKVPTISCAQISIAQYTIHPLLYRHIKR